MDDTSFAEFQKNISPHSIRVFPSEIASESWLRRTIRCLDLKAVSKTGFISWDRFKKENFVFAGSGKPVNKLDRTLFIHSLIESNRSSGLFSSLIPCQYKDDSVVFAKSLIKLLPELRDILDHVGVSDPEKKADFVKLFHEYTGFLYSNGLFEPGYEHPEIDLKGKNHVIMFPEIIEDFTRYEALLTGNTNVSYVHAYDFNSSDPRLLSFENSLHEGRWLFNNLRSLLQKGVEPEEISITVCNLDEVKSQLLSSGALYGVPLQIHWGKGVSSFIASTVFARIRECNESDFGLKALKALLLNRSIPWKNPRIASALIELGIEHKCLKSSGARGLDSWEQGFGKESGTPGKRSATIPEISGFYRRLTAGIKAICGSGSFAELRGELRTFALVFFDRGAWEEEPLDIFQFALSILDDLCATYSMLTGCMIRDPFSVFLEYLDEVIYVKRKSPRSVPVYPYRVSAGVMPCYHFVFNSSQMGIKHITGDLPFLNELEKSLMDPGAGSSGLRRNFTEDFFRLYAISGDEVVMTHSREGERGRNILPSLALSEGKIESFCGSESFIGIDPYIAEEKLWLKGSIIGSGAIAPLQKKGFENARRTALLPKYPDYTQTNAGNCELEECILGRLEKSGMLGLSATKLEIYVSCPFRFMLERGLGIENREWEIAIEDPVLFGTIIHRIFERFYEGIRESNDGYLPSGLAQAKILMEETVKDTLAWFERLFPVPIAPVWRNWNERFLELSLLFAEKEWDCNRDLRLVDVERMICKELREEKILLEGKIDRISEKDGALSVIDYKKKKGVSQKEIYGEGSTSFQIPLYVYLAESELEKPVERAGYYLIEDGKYSYILDTMKEGKGENERLQMDNAISEMLNKIQKAASGIRSGDFTIPSDAESDGCRWCFSRGICRTKFLIDEGGTTDLRG